MKSMLQCRSMSFSTRLKIWQDQYLYMCKNFLSSSLAVFLIYFTLQNNNNKYKNRIYRQYFFRIFPVDGIQIMDCVEERNTISGILNWMGEGKEIRESRRIFLNFSKQLNTLLERYSKLGSLYILFSDT